MYSEVNFDKYSEKRARELCGRQNLMAMACIAEVTSCQACQWGHNTTNPAKLPWLECCQKSISLASYKWSYLSKLQESMGKTTMTISEQLVQGYRINSFCISSMKQFLFFEELQVALCSVDNCVLPSFIYRPYTEVRKWWNKGQEKCI